MGSLFFSYINSMKALYNILKIYLFPILLLILLLGAGSALFANDWGKTGHRIVGEIAEREGHHPDIWFGWGYAKIKIYTHAIKGLAESDFILAAKIDKIN